QLPRPARLDCVVLYRLTGIAGGRALLAQIVVDVLRLEILVGDVIAGRAAEPVGAALGYQVDADAARLLRDVHTAGVDRDLLERVEVVIARRRACRRHVGDVDAI